MKTKNYNSGGILSHKLSLGKLAFSAAALFALNTVNAQNTSLNTDNIPVPGTGSNDVLIGNGSLLLNTTGSANTAIGDFVMSVNTTGGANSACGYGALNSVDASGNSALGAKSLVQTTTGNENSALGIGAGAVNTTGNNNTAVGSWADFAANNLVNASAFGNGAVVQNSNLVQLGDANVTQIECWSGTYATTSDGRFKFAISESDVKGLDFINRLRPVVYNMDTRKLTEFMVKGLSDEAKKKHLDKNFENSTAVRQSGFIAQEVEAAAKASGYNFNGVNIPKDENGHYSVSYSQFVVPLVKAVQEQQKMIDEQKKANEKLQQLVEAQQKSINALLERSGNTGIANNVNVGSAFNMGQNEPNPFTRETVVNYTIPQEVNNAYMAVYDLSGKQITTFAINQKGASSIVINSEKLSSGIYIYSIVADGKVVDSKRMIVADK